MTYATVTFCKIPFVLQYNFCLISFMVAPIGAKKRTVFVTNG